MEMDQVKRALFTLCLLTLLGQAQAWNDDDRQVWGSARTYEMPAIRLTQPAESPRMRFARELFEGSIKGEFIKRPTFANVLGNLLVNFTPAAILSDSRDFVANLKKSYETNFKNYKFNTAISLAGFIPLAGEVKKIGQAYQLGKLDRAINALASEVRFAKVVGENGSGLTRRLQFSIMQSLDEGEYLAVRHRPYGANFFDGIFPAKPATIKRADESYANGMRVMKDGRRFISDVDLAFVMKDGKMLKEQNSLRIGEKINESYGHKVVTHGDNYSGARRGIDGAIDIERKNEEIWVFGRDGFLDSGPYQEMLKAAQWRSK